MDLMILWFVHALQIKNIILLTMLVIYVHLTQFNTLMNNNALVLLVSFLMDQVTL